MDDGGAHGNDEKYRSPEADNHEDADNPGMILTVRMLTNAEKPDEDSADLAEKPHDFLEDGADTTDLDEQKTLREVFVCW